MVDILEFIDELKELQVLYQTGDLRDFDLQAKIQKYENQVALFEYDIEEQHNLLFKNSPVTYNPISEV
jgi:hypothetical protein